MPTTTITPRLAAETIPTFVLTLVCGGFPLQIPQEALALALASQFSENAKSRVNHIALAIAQTVLERLYGTTDIAPDPLDVLRRLGADVRAFDKSRAWEQVVADISGGILGSEHHTWVRTGEDGAQLILFVDTSNPGWVQRQALMEAIGDLVLLRFGVPHSEINPASAEIGRWVLCSPDVIRRVVGEFGETFTTPEFDRALRELGNHTSLDCDSAIETLEQYVENHFGHSGYQHLPFTALPGREEVQAAEDAVIENLHAGLERLNEESAKSRAPSASVAA